MRKLLLCSAVLVAAGCSDSTESRPPARVAVAPATITFDALRATRVVRATVEDDRGRALTGERLTWTSSAPSVVVVESSGGDSAVVRSLKNGTAQITAQAGEASGEAQAQVAVTGTLTVLAGDQQAALAGAQVPTAPAVRVTDSRGIPQPAVSVTFTATEGGGTVGGAASTVVVTDVNGVATLNSWRLGPAFNVLTATTSDLTAAPVTVQAAGCAGGGGAGYAITVCYTTRMTPSQRAVFETSSARWSTAITGDVPDLTFPIAAGTCGSNPAANFTYDDLVIFAAVTDIDGPGGVLGQAGPCFVRNGSRIPVAGTMQFDNADLLSLESSNRLGAVILHEMGHVLGIGTLWTTFGLLADATPDTATVPRDTYYTGPEGLAGFEAIGGSLYVGRKVPVENTGGPGTRNGHWREAVLRNELMTGFLNAGSNPMSVLTIRSLADLGYMVNPGAADPFSLTFALRDDGGSEAGIKLHDDVLDLPLFAVDERGRRTRVR
jgi:hypothetical protein